MTLEQAREVVEAADECGGQITDEHAEALAAAKRTIAVATDQPWWTYEGIGPEEQP